MQGGRLGRGSRAGERLEKDFAIKGDRGITWGCDASLRGMVDGPVRGEQRDGGGRDGRVWGGRGGRVKQRSELVVVEKTCVAHKQRELLGLLGVARASGRR